MVALCVGDAAADRIVVQLVDSKIGHSGGEQGALNQRVVDPLLRQIDRLLLSTTIQLLIRIIRWRHQPAALHCAATFLA